MHKILITHITFYIYKKILFQAIKHMMHIIGTQLLCRHLGCHKQWEPVFPEWGAVREAFDELVDDLSLPADTIIADVSLEGVVSNLFGAGSD